MLEKTLEDIKVDLRKLHNIYEVLITEWNGELKHGNDAIYPITVTVGVLLGNMAHQSVNTVGYSHNKDMEKLARSLNTLQKLNEYNNKCYMTHFAYTEAEAIITGHIMSEENFSP